MSQFTLFYPQDITFSVRAMFSVWKMTALCIQSRISPPRGPNSSLIASSTSVYHPPKISMMMLYCWMSYSGNMMFEFPAEAAILDGLLLLLLFSVLRAWAFHFYRQNFLLLMIYKFRIHSVLLYLLTYCKNWYIPIYLGLG